MNEQQKRELVAAFMDAWQRADHDGVMRLMSDQCRYGASVGPEPGMTYRGMTEVGQGVAEMLDFESGGESRRGRVWFADDCAFAEWDYDEISDDGSPRAVRGIDVIHFADGKIQSIEAYRKASK